MWGGGEEGPNLMHLIQGKKVNWNIKYKYNSPLAFCKKLLLLLKSFVLKQYADTHTPAHTNTHNERSAS